MPRAPEIDGIKLATKIRQISDIPIILYTGSGSDEVASSSFEVARAIHHSSRGKKKDLKGR